VLLTICLPGWCQKRKIIIDQDAAEPAGTNQQSMLLLIQSPQTKVLGITVVTGDQWLKAEVAHTLWDELPAAAWLDPSLITARETRFMDINLDRGAGYGDTLTWGDRDKPTIETRPVKIQASRAGRARRPSSLLIATIPPSFSAPARDRDGV